MFALPFGLGPLEYVEADVRHGGDYAYLSVNAYNPWALLGSDGHVPLARRLGLVARHDAAARARPRRRHRRGCCWSPGSCGASGARAARATAGRSSWRAAYLCMAFFILPTRVHERYLFPVFVFLPLLAVVDRRWLVSLVVTRHRRRSSTSTAS